MSERFRTLRQFSDQLVSMDLDPELAGLCAFLARGGNRQSCYFTGSASRWLDQVKSQLAREDWGSHIVATAFDNIPSWARELLSKVVTGQASFTPESATYLRDRGFILGSGFPRLVRERAQLWAWVYDAG